MNGFLAGGGEMGERTRQYKWAETSIGTPDAWPAALRTTLGIMLHSAFPMFLLWGEDLLCFYNDAFRPSLGQDGKHPALGNKGKDVWSEIWDFIGPLIAQVMLTGEPVWFEDQLVPFYRNGKIEQIYWTFSYSPVYGDNGKAAGVFVTCTETTQKVSNLRQLDESKKELEFAIDAADLGTWDLNPRTNKFSSNGRLKEWFGLHSDREIDLPLALSVMHEGDRDRVTNAILRALDPESGGQYDTVYRIINSHTGDEKIVRAKGKALFDESNKPIRFNGILQDITEQNKAEIVEQLARQKIEESDQQIRTMVQSAPFPIGVYAGKDMCIELANEAMIQAWGKGNEVIGKLFREILPELADQSIFDQLEKVYHSGEAFHVRNQSVAVEIDGLLQTSYFNYSLTPLFDSNGKVYGVMNTAADVTDLVMANKKVEESESNFRNTILRAPVAICIFKGPQFVVEIANERMYELWGKNAADMLHKPLFEGLAEGRNQGYEELLTHIYTTGQTHTAQELSAILPRNGVMEQHYIDVLYEPERGANGEITGIIAVAILVTDQVKGGRQIEELVAERTNELAQANQNLARSNADLSQFAHIASHDLQEPIRKVVVYAGMLEDRAETLDEQTKSFLRKIRDASKRMQILIRDILSYSELSKHAPFYEPVSLQTIVQDVKAEYELLIEQRGAQIYFHDLPTIDAIPLQMTQLFSNLISNGLKYTNPGTPPVINIDAHVDGNQIHLEVKDQGIGFDQQYADRIFSIFQRLHRKTEYTGTGIGLAICKRIAQNHQGSIYAVSNPGKGSNFHIILPIHQ